MRNLAEINFDINEMTNRVAFGIPLKDSEGNPFPEDLLQSYLDSAIAWAEQTLNIVIMPREELEEHDYFLTDYTNWGFIRLWKKPIIEVESLEMWYGEQKMFDIPKDWLKIDKLSGQISLFPTSGSAGGMIITASGGLVTPLLTGNIGYAPKLWRVRYKAGLEAPDPNEPHVYRQNHIHPNLIECIYKKAAIGVMGVYGDLIIGPGIANQSISLDGISQSVGTTQSAMFGGASARIDQLQKDIDSYIPALRSYYDGINMTVI